MTHELVVQRREDHGIYEDLNSHLLTLTQLAEESTALNVCPFRQKVRRGGDYLSHSLTIAIQKRFDELFTENQRINNQLKNDSDLSLYLFFADFTTRSG